jgi:alkanesulfonate monooxygenase SsuD/methylene tetrahydromethanopterin reductase-like flavin-dependent oxidoreductase (luciferase family)
MQAIWTQDEAAYDGEFTQFEPIWSWPKPVQQPHPPILLGGETKYTLQRVVDFCDGWFPRLRGGDPKPAMERLRDVADEGGRDIKTISTILFGTPDDADYIESCREAGLDRVLFALPSEGSDVLLPRLDELQNLAR